MVKLIIFKLIDCIILIIYQNKEEEKLTENDNEYKITDNQEKNIQNKSRLAQMPSKAQIYHYEKTIYDLTLKIEDMNSHNEKLLLQIEKSKAIIESLQTEIKILKEQLINQNNNNQNLLETISNNNLMIQELKDLNKKLVSNSKIKLETLNKELNEKENIIKSYNQQLKTKDETIKYYTINNNLSNKYSNNNKKELEEQKSINKNLEQKIRELNKQIDTLYLNKQSEGSLLLEIENLKDDNIRLIQMLKSMKQAEDLESLNLEKGSMKNIKIYKNNNNKNMLLNEAFSYGIKLRQKFGLDISNTILKNFVAGINRIWQEKYEKDIKAIKMNYRKELDSFHAQQTSNYKNIQTQISSNTSRDNISTNISNINLNNSNIYKFNNIDDYEKGCLWMVERCSEEMNNLFINLNELFQEYEEKLNNSLKDSNPDNKDNYSRVVNNCVKWFFTALKSMIEEKNNQMNEWRNEIKAKCAAFNNEINK